MTHDHGSSIVGCFKQFYLYFYLKYAESREYAPSSSSHSNTYISPYLNLNVSNKPFVLQCCRCRLLCGPCSVLRVVLLQRDHRVVAVLPGGLVVPGTSLATLQPHLEHTTLHRQHAQQLQRLPPTQLPRLRVLSVRSCFLFDLFLKVLIPGPGWFIQGFLSNPRFKN